jgi:hypothetical protein
MAKKKQAQVVMVTDSCGCVFCDLDLEPNTRIKNMGSTNASAEYFHPTKRGDIPCTKPR